MIYSILLCRINYRLLFHSVLFFFFFNDTATTEIYTLSLHDALPIFSAQVCHSAGSPSVMALTMGPGRSEEHTSELQSRRDLVCRLLLENKKRNLMDKADYELSMTDRSKSWCG